MYAISQPSLLQWLLMCRHNHAHNQYRTNTCRRPSHRRSVGEMHRKSTSEAAAIFFVRVETVPSIMGRRQAIRQFVLVSAVGKTAKLMVCGIGQTRCWVRHQGISFRCRLSWRRRKLGFCFLDVGKDVVALWLVTLEVCLHSDLKEPRLILDQGAKDSF